jgi:hypothetical protein
MRLQTGTIRLTSQQRQTSAGGTRDDQRLTQIGPSFQMPRLSPPPGFVIITLQSPVRIRFPPLARPVSNKPDPRVIEKGQGRNALAFFVLSPETATGCVQRQWSIVSPTETRARPPAMPRRSPNRPDLVESLSFLCLSKRPGYKPLGSLWLLKSPRLASRGKPTSKRWEYKQPGQRSTTRLLFPCCSIYACWRFQPRKSPPPPSIDSATSSRSSNRNSLASGPGISFGIGAAVSYKSTSSFARTRVDPCPLNS